MTVGTTNTLLARRLLEEIEALGVAFSVLHNAEVIEQLGSISDVDILVNADPSEIIEKLTMTIDADELALVLRWRYDTGALTTFWMTPGLEDGVQLDLMHDPRGKGRYGVRTSTLHERHHQEDAWPPRLSERGSALYVFSKRLVKGDHSRWQQAVGVLTTSGGLDLSVYVRSRRRRYARAYDGDFPGRGFRVGVSLRQRVSRNGWGRLFRRTGAVVEMPGKLDQAVRDQVTAMITPVIPHAVVVDSRPGPIRCWWLTRRPRIVVIDGSGPAMTPDSARHHVWLQLRELARGDRR